MSMYESTRPQAASSHFANSAASGANSAVSVKTEDAEANGEPKVVISQRTGKPKRRKAVRACIHCQRTHLTCDNNRPCERCIHRGFADSCRDGVRKKAKYLGVDELSSGSGASPAMPKPTGKYRISPGPAITEVPPGIPQHDGLQAVQSVPALPQMPVDLNPVPFYDQYAGVPRGLPGPHRFQSQTTDLEYSVLGNILQADQSESSPSFSDDASSVHHQRTTSLPSYQPRINNYNLNQQSLSDVLFQHEQQNATTFDEWIDYPKPPPMSLTINERNRSEADVSQSLDDSYLQPLSALKTQDSLPNTGLHRTKSSTTVMTMARTQQRNPAEIYQSVTRPFPYTPGFHALIRYLKSRFTRVDLMEIVRYMASYRPSFIAITNSLTEDDLVFMEKYFQRTLLEYEKYFVYSGTPTIVWRRTGQIAAVGHEFCVLSGWSMEQLLSAGQGTGRFIVEVMDNKSVVDYFKMFSEISFNDSSGSTMSVCTLMSPQGQPVKTSCVLTVRKDLFGIPMMMIGNFLPILG